MAQRLECPLVVRHSLQPSQRGLRWLGRVPGQPGARRWHGVARGGACMMGGQGSGRQREQGSQGRGEGVRARAQELRGELRGRGRGPIV